MRYAKYVMLAAAASLVLVGCAKKPKGANTNVQENANVNTDVNGTVPGATATPAAEASPTPPGPAKTGTTEDQSIEQELQDFDTSSLDQEINDIEQELAQ